MRSVVFHERCNLSEVLMEVGMEGLRGGKGREGKGGGWRGGEVCWPPPPPPTHTPTRQISIHTHMGAGSRGCWEDKAPCPSCLKWKMGGHFSKASSPLNLWASADLEFEAKSIEWVELWALTLPAELPKSCRRLLTPRLRLLMNI